MIKIVSISIAAILVTSIVTATSFSMSNAKPIKLDSFEDMSLDNHDPNLLVMHYHLQLQLFINGQQVILPANIGIDEALHYDRSLDKYSASPQIAPIHTHSADGVIHLESTVMRDYTMQEFMGISGFDSDQIRTISMTVDGKLVEDYENHALKDGQHIVLDISI